MIAGYIKRELRKFSARYDYDTSYMTELVDADSSGGIKFALASQFIGHRFGLPAGPYFAAKVVALRSADCGACLKLAIRMAEEAGVAATDIAAVLLGPEESVPADMALAARYGRSVVENDPDIASVIDECEARWGKRGVAGLAAAVVSGVFYPILKRGLGHGNSCEPVVAWLRSRAGMIREREAERQLA